MKSIVIGEQWERTGDIKLEGGKLNKRSVLSIYDAMLQGICYAQKTLKQKSLWLMTLLTGRESCFVDHWADIYETNRQKYYIWSVAM